MPWYKILRPTNFDKEEQSALIQSPFLNWEDDLPQIAPEAKISNMQAAWNIFNANQGVVILTFPFAFKLGGIFPLFIVIICISLISNYTSKKLIQCLYEQERDSGILIRVRDTYDDIGYACFGTIGRSLVCIAMVIEQLCYCTVNLILCSNILYNAFSYLPLEKFHWVCITFLILSPNALLASLQQVSILSLVTVIAGNAVYSAVSIYCLVTTEQWGLHNHDEKFDMNGLFTAIGIIVASYASQPYMPAIEGSMKNRHDFNKVTDATFLVITLIKFTFGWLCYMAYGEDTRQVITNNLPRGIFRSVCVAVVLLLGLMSFTFPAFTVYTLMDKITDSVKSYFQYTNPYGELSVAIHLQSKESHYWRSFLYTAREIITRMALLSIAPLMAIFIPHFGYYVALVGNITGICLSLIFPSLFYIKIKYYTLPLSSILLLSMVGCFGCLAAGVGTYFSSSALYEAIADEQT